VSHGRSYSRGPGSGSTHGAWSRKTQIRRRARPANGVGPSAQGPWSTAREVSHAADAGLISSASQGLLVLLTQGSRTLVEQPPDRDPWGMATNPLHPSYADRVDTRQLKLSGTTQ